jgi:hypothetical protein
VKVSTEVGQTSITFTSLHALHSAIRLQQFFMDFGMHVFQFDRKKHPKNIPYIAKVLSNEEEGKTFQMMYNISNLENI